MSTYNIEKITKEVNEVCGNAGYTGVKYLKISLNPRLTTTLGRVKYTKSPNGYIYNSSIEFSEKFINNGSDKEVHDVILHECAHAIATYRTKTKQGHNEYFKSVCAEIGTTNDKCCYAREEENKTEPIYKYKVYCSECGELIASYKRKGKVIKYLDFYKCGLCGGKLIVKID